MTSAKAVWSRILVATDGSEAARPAEDCARDLAQVCGASLDLVSVVEFESWRDLSYDVNRLYLDARQREVREALDEAAARLRVGDRPVTTHDPVGNPSQEIVALAASLPADLVVLGTHGRTGLDHVLIGSTAERVVRAATCDVLTIRAGVAHASVGESGAQRKPPFQRLLVPVDFSDYSQAVVDAATRLARGFGSLLTLLHIVEPIGYGVDFTIRHALSGSALREDAERALDQLVATCRAQGVTAEGRVVPGLPTDAIVRAAEACESDAIVMGTHGRRGWSRLRFGSVAEAVVRQAGCPVITVRCGDEARRQPS
ncbi:MAG: universal stress protein [Nitrospiraceae bacterium]